jgi:hypothetical protein
MNKKKWALLLLGAVLIFGYIKLFYKTYSNNVVAQSADCIIAIDVKRVTNTLIWNFITTPGQWKPGNIFKSSSTKAEISWKDMIVLPDYVFGFHVKGQPANTWYSVFAIKNSGDFEKGLLRYHFTKQNNQVYQSEEMGLRFFRHENKILVSNNKAGNGYLEQVATELFTKSAFIAKATLKKAVDAKSHAAIYIAANKFLQQDGLITANFSGTTITAEAKFSVAQQYHFTEQVFNFSDSSLCTLGFTQPSYAVYQLMSDSSRAKISKAINVNIDSFLRPGNQYYNLDLAGFKSRTDSAITYSYDDDFNSVEKVVVNNVLEPAYDFNIVGDSVTSIYNYFVSSNKLEQTGSGQLFTPMPFVKSYCTIKNLQQLNIRSANYVQQQPNNKNTGIFFLQLRLSKIPAELLKYLPGDVIKAMANVEYLHIKAVKQKEQVVLNGIVQKKKNDLPLIKL